MPKRKKRMKTKKERNKNKHSPGAADGKKSSGTSSGSVSVSRCTRGNVQIYVHPGSTRTDVKRFLEELYKIMFLLHSILSSFFSQQFHQSILLLYIKLCTCFFTFLCWVTSHGFVFHLCFELFAVTGETFPAILYIGLGHQRRSG